MISHFANESDQIHRARVARSFVTLHGIKFLARPPIGAERDRCIREAIAAHERSERATTPQEAAREMDTFWRRLLVDHVPGFERHYEALGGVIEAHELENALRTTMGINIKFDVKVGY